VCVCVKIHNNLIDTLGSSKCCLSYTLSQKPEAEEGLKSLYPVLGVSWS
jgi:hypothetical protein